MYGKYEDKHLYFAKAQYNFIESIYNENEFRALISLLNLIETGAVLIGLNEGDITKAYYLKNAQNQKRVEGGQQAGTYDKSKETPLTLN
jgi:hypothetical protein